MHKTITRLLSIGGEPIGDPVSGTEALDKWGTLGFVKIVADTVYLEKKNGSTVKVPKDRLSEDDLQWIKDHTEKAKH
ncbi:MAG: SHD1 domain-containing protein [Thermoguttaceae bacterium]